MRELRRVARELLTERQRRRVLQVRAADFDDVDELPRFGGQRCLQGVDRGHEIAGDRFRGCHVHRRGKDIVRRLAAIDIVVGMHPPAVAPRAAEDLRGTVGKHFVDVHVGLRAGAGLPDREWKFAVVPSGKSFVGCGYDGLSRFRGQDAELHIHLRRCALDDQQRADERGRHLLRRNAEVLQRTLRLCAPQVIFRDFDRSEGVALGACGSNRHERSPHSAARARHPAFTSILPPWRRRFRARHRRPSQTNTNEKGARRRPLISYAGEITPPAFAPTARPQARRVAEWQVLGHLPRLLSSTAAGGPCRRPRAP